MKKRLFAMVYHRLQSSYVSFHRVNNEGADQTARMHRLVCIFDIRMQQSPIFSWRSPYYVHSCLVCSLDLILYISVNSYGHVETVS